MSYNSLIKHAEEKLLCTCSMPIIFLLFLLRVLFTPLPQLSSSKLQRWLFPFRINQQKSEVRKCVCKLVWMSVNMCAYTHTGKKGIFKLWQRCHGPGGDNTHTQGSGVSIADSRPLPPSQWRDHPLRSLSHLQLYGVTFGPAPSGHFRAQATQFDGTGSSWERDFGEDADIILNPGTSSKDLEEVKSTGERTRDVQAESVWTCQTVTRRLGQL